MGTLLKAERRNGAVSQLTYPDGTAVPYLPNALGEPTKVGTYASAVTYHPNGAIAGFTYGNGIVHTLQQNVRGLPEWSIDAGVLRDNYGYDQNGNVTAILDWQLGVSNQLFPERRDGAHGDPQLRPCAGCPGMSNNPFTPSIPDIANRNWMFR